MVRIWDIFPPENWLEKLVNLLMNLMMGIAIYFYKKSRKFAWPIRKFLELLTLLLMGIGFMIVNMIISNFLRLVLL
ncbi:hypothetical protein D1970_07170 [Mesobacillus zeae]|uniref:DUF4181 domain-containing protein n=1 Tax=Mesobacillus zeae TaxID=1917180 RepID=A0A398BF42_9BACI|nr:hypothetical protein D1970_07170 [Mesobacillus zeae]